MKRKKEASRAKARTRAAEASSSRTLRRPPSVRPRSWAWTSPLRRGALLPGGWHRGGAHRRGDCPGLERRHNPGDRTRLRPPAPAGKGIVLGIVRQFEAMGATDKTEPVARSVDRPAD